MNSQKIILKKKIITNRRVGDFVNSNLSIKKFKRNQYRMHINLVICSSHIPGEITKFSFSLYFMFFCHSF